jgi:hypothetical protein
MQKENFASVFLSEILIFEIEKCCVLTTYVYLLRQNGVVLASKRETKGRFMRACAREFYSFRKYETV